MGRLRQLIDFFSSLLFHLWECPLVLDDYRSTLSMALGVNWTFTHMKSLRRLVNSNINSYRTGTVQRMPYGYDTLFYRDRERTDPLRRLIHVIHGYGMVSHNHRLLTGGSWVVSTTVNLPCSMRHPIPPVL